MAAQNQTGRRVTRTKRTEATILQIRVTNTTSPDLFDFVMSLPEGTASSFGRNVLDQALRAGFLTPSGFALTDEDRFESLQMQLQIARDDLVAANEKNAILTRRISELQDAVNQRSATESSAEHVTVPTPQPAAIPTAQQGNPGSGDSVEHDAPVLADQHKPVDPVQAQPALVRPQAIIESSQPTQKRTLPRGFADALRSGQD